MKALVWTLGYLAVHLVSIALLIRLRPEWVLHGGTDGKYTGVKLHREAYPDIGVDVEAFMLLAVAPLSLVVVVPVSIVLRSSIKSLNNKTAARAELEKELAAARKEIDELLGRRPA